MMIASVMICAAAASFLIWGVSVLVMGGEECLKMAMNDEFVVSAKLPQASRWARTLSDAAMPYGVMSNDMPIVIAALNRVTEHDRVSEYNNVTAVTVNTRREYVSVKIGMSENRIYARPEQLDFVADFIAQRCTKARIKK